MNIKIGNACVSFSKCGMIENIIISDNSVYQKSEQSYLVQLGINTKVIQPLSMVIENDVIIFTFENDINLSLKFIEKDSYTTFEVISLSKECENIIFGPVACNINGTIGEVLGVIKGEEYSLCIQGLNIKTLAGFPREYINTPQSRYNGFQTMSDISVDRIEYFESAAYKTDFGGIVQLYCENRNRERIKDFEGQKNIKVPPLHNGDESVIGAKFALFSCESKDILNVIEKIELNENLPHPLIGGKWVKTAREAMRSYFITEFNPDNFEKMLEYTQKGGFENIYHSEPFANWGHFDLRKDCFPDGDDTLKQMCDKAKEKNIGIGLHTLSNFTSTHDKYVSPVPDKHLAKAGEAVLIKDIEPTDKEIYATGLDLFKQPSNLNSLQINDEIIKYESAVLSEEYGPNDSICILKNCERGAFGTSASTHKKDTEIYKLLDHGYNIFFPDVYLQDKYTDRLVDLFNRTGLIQISFDGLEGCRYTGEDEYAVNRFCDNCYRGWNNQVINDASRLNHYLWHMHTRMNWGEPWGAKMREGMIEARINNQEFYRKNLFPRMLGWFLIRTADRKFEATAIEDIEWALSKAAGFDAGFSFVASERTLDGLGNTEEILNIVKLWEYLRLENKFPDDLKAKLKDEKSEWHLSKKDDGYELLPLQISQTFVCDLSEMQPGQKGGADWSYTNSFGTQNYDCKIKFEGDGELKNPSLTTKNGLLRFNCTMTDKQYIICKDGQAILTDINYVKINDVDITGIGTADKGNQGLSFNGNCTGEGEVSVKIYTYGEAIKIL